MIKVQLLFRVYNSFSNAFFNEDVSISTDIALKFVPVNNISALVQIMRPGDKLDQLWFVY